MTDGAVATLAPSPYIVQGNVIDGKAVADQIRKEISATVSMLKERHGKVRHTRVTMEDPCKRSASKPSIHMYDLPAAYSQVPGLAVVIVGERKDSQTYVRMKRRACAEVGFRSFDCDMPGDSTQQEVLEQVAKFNADPNVHGILVQLPVSNNNDESWGSAAQRPGLWRLQRSEGLVHVYVGG